MLAILLGPIPLAYFLSSGTSGFEGARGFAIVALVPIIAVVLLAALIALFLAVRKHASRCKVSVWSIAVFVMTCAVSYAWMNL